jgi:glycosyltransferase involved in cell wall biosynthesis
VSAYPTVSVVIATRDRVGLLQQAVESVLAQDYGGPIEVVVVFDQCEPIPELARDHGSQTVRVVSNSRTPGLAGARNSGIVTSAGEYVAFCDDDDTWHPHKLRRQLRAVRDLDAVGAVAGIEIHYDDAVQYRVPNVDRITIDDLARGRMTGAHPSTFLFRRDALLGSIGLVDEDLPHGYGEDYDLLIRAVKHGSVAVVGAPLAVVLWHRGSYFSQRWEAMADGLGYLLEKHPELRKDPAGHAWIEGQRAFAFAASGNRSRAWQAARRSLRLNPREPRAVLALLVAARLLSAARVMHALNSRGHGI